MSTQLSNDRDDSSPNSSPIHTPTNAILNLPFSVNSITRDSQPPHFSALLNTRITVGTHVCTVEEVIAEGGFGVICSVKSEKQKYALKRVIVNSTRDYESVIGEVAIMSLLGTRTQNLLKSISHVSYIYDHTYEIQNLMPLCSRNLLQLANSRMAKSQNFEMPELLNIVISVASGLSYLHNSVTPIIHRDIKIENVLVLDDSYVLSDFGSATTKVWDPSNDPISAINEDLDKYTTLTYRSPEMVDLYGGRGPINVASDIWALGVSLFKLMSFKDPFESILAIQNRNFDKKLDQVKQKYKPEMIQLLEILLSEHQITRPNVEEVTRLSISALSSSDWSGVQTAFTRMVEETRLREEANKKTTHAGAPNIVMETTVTPRQRPKRGATTVPACVTQQPTQTNLPPVLAPPKSPKPVSPVNTVIQSETNNTTTKFFSSNTERGGVSATVSPNNATPSPPRVTSSGVGNPAPTPCSWNPFDTDPEISEQEASTNEHDNLPNPFDNAPFDYFKYQPILMSQEDPESYTGTSSRLIGYAANNPFLYEPDYVHSYDVSNNNPISAGVCNLSFDDRSVSNNNNAAAQQQQQHE